MGSDPVAVPPPPPRSLSSRSSMDVEPATGKKRVSSRTGNNTAGLAGPEVSSIPTSGVFGMFGTSGLGVCIVKLTLFNHFLCVNCDAHRVLQCDERLVGSGLAPFHTAYNRQYHLGRSV